VIPAHCGLKRSVQAKDVLFFADQFRLQSYDLAAQHYPSCVRVDSRFYLGPYGR